MDSIGVIEITQEVANDINLISGKNHLLSKFAPVTVCFGTVDFGVDVCQGCKIQRACAVYQEERLGGQSVRPLLGTGSDSPVPPDVQAIIVAARERAAGLVAPTSPVAPPPPEPATSPTVTPPPPPPQYAPPAPPAPVAPAPPAPAPASVTTLPSDGSPPAGWPNLEREDLAQICRQLGYTDADLHKKRASGLVLLIVERRPEWPTSTVTPMGLPDDGSPPPGWPELSRDDLVRVCLSVGYQEDDTKRRRPSGLVEMIVDKRPAWGGSVQGGSVPPPKSQTAALAPPAPSPASAAPPDPFVAGIMGRGHAPGSPATLDPFVAGMGRGHVPDVFVTMKAEAAGSMENVLRWLSLLGVNQQQHIRVSVEWMASGDASQSQEAG
jgi:hypothetical protein